MCVCVHVSIHEIQSDIMTEAMHDKANYFPWNLDWQGGQMARLILDSSSRIINQIINSQTCNHRFH